MDSGLCSNTSSLQSGQIRHPNGVGVHVTPQKVKVKTDPLAESATESQLISATSNSHDHLHDGHSEAATNADLSQNFKYAQCAMWLHVYTCTLYMASLSHQIQMYMYRAVLTCSCGFGC